MPAKTLYLTNSVSTWPLLSETSPGANATIGTGWTVATEPAGDSASMQAAVERAAGNFTTSAKPSIAPSSSLGDAFRAGPFTGTFNAGTWSLIAAVLAVDAGGWHDGHARWRVWKSINANGSSPTELTTATLVGSSVVNLGIGGQQSSSVNWSPGAIALNSEYLFFQLAWAIDGAGISDIDDCLLRIGDTASRIVTPNFSVPVLGNNLFFGSDL